jgi:hypothetical protein
LLLVGLLIVQSDHVPSALGILVALAGLAYVVGELTPVVMPDSRDALMALIVVLALPGELGLTAWLLLRGGKVGPARDRHEQPAAMTRSAA